MLRLATQVGQGIRRTTGVRSDAPGKMNGYFCQGFNPLAAIPNKAKLIRGLSKLKYLVVIDPLATETSWFWENHGEYNDVDPTNDPDRSHPPSFHLLRRGERVAYQFRPLAAVALQRRLPPGDAKPDADIIAGIFLKLRELYGRREAPSPTRS